MDRAEVFAGIMLKSVSLDTVLMSVKNIIFQKHKNNDDDVILWMECNPPEISSR